MGTDRRDDDGIEPRVDDRAAGRQRVGGGPGGRRDDHPVSSVEADLVLVHPDLEVHDTDQPPSVQNSIIESIEGLGFVALMLQPRLEPHPRV